MIAIVDETTPEIGGGILYAVVSAVLVASEVEARAELTAVLGPSRRRPFRWSQEGPRAREAMVACMASIGVVGRAVVVQCGRRGQERARAIALADTVRHVLSEGCSELLIESRSQAEDGRDRSVVLDTLATVQPSRELRYGWHGKDEPLLWFADAAAGAVREHLQGEDAGWFGAIRGATDLTIDYRSSR